MRRVEDFKDNAKECRKLASRMPPAQREQLLQMAKQWEEVAIERERTLTLAATTTTTPRLRVLRLH